MRKQVIRGVAKDIADIVSTSQVAGKPFWPGTGGVNKGVKKNVIHMTQSAGRKGEGRGIQGFRNRSSLGR